MAVCSRLFLYVVDGYTFEFYNTGKDPMFVMNLVPASKIFYCDLRHLLIPKVLA